MKKLAGWAKAIGEKVREVAHLLIPPLKAVAGFLHAISFSIGVAFPWGVSVSVAF